MFLGRFDLGDVQDIYAVVGIAAAFGTIVALLMGYYYKAKIENIQRRHPAAFSGTRAHTLSPEPTTTLERIASGMNDHYDSAVKLVQSADAEVFLMQRSSTLILGPEEGWHEEANFYNALFDKLREGVVIRHVVSLDGMLDHLKRPGSKFPGVKEALKFLPVNKEGIVVLTGPSGSFPVKVVPHKFQDEYTRLDRQARTLVVRRKDGVYKAGIVLDLGVTQYHFVMAGPLIADFYRACRDFYNKCPDLRWEDLNKRLAPWLSAADSGTSP